MFMLTNLTNKKTIICKPLLVINVIRNMETSTTDYSDCFRHFMRLTLQRQECSPELKYQADRCAMYVAECVDNAISFQKMIEYSQDALGYRLDSRSFLPILDTLKIRLPQHVDALLNLDNLGLYDPTTKKMRDDVWPRCAEELNDLTQCPNRSLPETLTHLKHYQKEIPETIPNTTHNIHETAQQSASENSTNASEKEDSETDSNYKYTSSESEKEQEDVNYDSSDTSSNDSHVSLKNTSSSSSNSNDSLGDETALFNNGNNNQIILLTVIAFGVIVFTAWFVRKYYPETLNNSNLEESECLHSVHENSLNIQNCIFQFALLFIPSSLYILYQYRYYFYYSLQLKNRRRVL